MIFVTPMFCRIRAALVAGGNRCAAFLMEWLGLPTLEASNAPDKLKKGTDGGPVPDPTNPDNATGVETQKSRGSEAAVDKLDDGGACLQHGGMDVTSPVGGSGGEVGELISDLTNSCDPMDGGGSSGNRTEHGIGDGSEAGIGSGSSSLGETGSVQSGTSSKRKSSSSQSVEPPKRIRTPEGGSVSAIGNGKGKETTGVVEEVRHSDMTVAFFFAVASFLRCGLFGSIFVCECVFWGVFGV